MKFKRTDLKDPNKAAFVYHPKDGALLVDHDQVDFYLERGWFDKPVTKEMLKKKLQEGNKGNKKGNEKNDSNSSDQTEGDDSNTQEGNKNEEQKK